MDDQQWKYIPKKLHNKHNRYKLEIIKNEGDTFPINEGYRHTHTHLTTVRDVKYNTICFIQNTEYTYWEIYTGDDEEYTNTEKSTYHKWIKIPCKSHNRHIELTADINEALNIRLEE